MTSGPLRSVCHTVSRPLDGTDGSVAAGLFDSSALRHVETEWMEFMMVIRSIRKPEDKTKTE